MHVTKEILKSGYTDDELLPLSALQHLMFCPRQCALIHIEQLWQENYFTAQGQNLHERVDRGGERAGSSLRVEYSVLLRSYRLGLYGKADLVEFHLNTVNGKRLWRPYPVEYKRGRPKKDDCDRIQLCAQAMCLEEQQNVSIEKGAIFYGRLRRRQTVIFDKNLRNKTYGAAKALHDLIRSGKSPRAQKTKKCNSCSLLELCMPDLSRRSTAVKEYLLKVVENL